MCFPVLRFVRAGCIGGYHIRVSHLVIAWPTLDCNTWFPPLLTQAWSTQSDSYSLTYTVWFIQYDLYSMTHTVWCIQYESYSITHTVWQVQYDSYSLFIQYESYSMTHTVWLIQYNTDSMTLTLNLIHYDTYITAHTLELIQYETCLSLSKQIYLNTWNLMIRIYFLNYIFQQPLEIKSSSSKRCTPIPCFWQALAWFWYPASRSPDIWSSKLECARGHDYRAANFPIWKQLRGCGTHNVIGRS